ncbi:hypothetical protein ADIAL_0807 [Alkalibacterium sp. AK22]|uniref:DUF2508 family protein n=1 Tax=Alkalibacterium sp. AK22 TaxID=1229520 RepID=UPI00044C4515|nr:DUF2508 family protein [Alkalibacterium sp. AK22]EXJ23692.1 hypothetical protein ADIAL_0807 [Alkalibacterium sp. AK22]
MGMFRKKHKLKKKYDQKLLDQIKKQKELYESGSQLEKIMVKDHPKWEAEIKLQRAKYFYLFKEARIRKLRGDLLN